MALTFVGVAEARHEQCLNRTITQNYFYDAKGRPIQEILPDGSVRQTRYDGMGAVVEVIDEAGHHTAFSRDALGLDTVITGPRGLRIETRHDAAGRLVLRREADAVDGDAVWTYSYPGNGWSYETAPAPDDATQRLHKKRLDGFGRVVETIDAAGNSERVSALEYDGPGVSRVTTRDGLNWSHVIRRQWDGQGRPTLESETWAAGARSYEYETQTVWTGRIAAVTNAWKSNGTTLTSPPETYIFNGLGDLARRTTGAVADAWQHDGLGRLSVFDSADAPPRALTYGSDGRVAQVSLGTSTPELTTYKYTTRGDLAETLMPDGRLMTTQYEYQSGAGRPLATLARISRAGDATESRTTYDELGRVLTITEGAGTNDSATTSFVYGPRGNLRSVTQPSGAVWTYGYTPLLQLAEVTPPAGAKQAVQRFEYNDGLGRRSRAVLGSSVWTTSYSGGISTESTAKGESIESLIDGRGRTASVQYRSGADTGPGLTSKSMRFDGWDALVQLVDTYADAPTETQTWSYDTSHRLASVTRSLASTVTYSYQPGTRLESGRTVAGVGGLSRSYDDFGRLSSVVGPWGASAISFEPGGQRLTQLGEQTFNFDGRGWLSSISSPQGIRSYGYDGRGNRVSESFGGATRQFLVDASDRLIASREWDGHIEAWKLAPDGSKTESKQWPASTPWLAGPAYFDTPGATSHNLYEYSTGLGALTAIKDATSGVDVLRYVLDANGQVTSRTHGGRTQNLAWDVDGRLVSATQVPVPGLSSFEMSVRYDGLGLRRSATVKQTPPTGPPVDSTQSWLWAGADGEDELAEGTNLTAIVGGHRLSEGVTPFITDALGSVVAQGGTGTASFTAQGIASSSGTLVSSAGFAGLRSEENSSLNYAQQRWHDPVSGQSLSVDSVGAANYRSRPNSLGRWAYGDLNPTRYVDPSGRFVPFVILGGLIAWESLVIHEEVTTGKGLTGSSDALQQRAMQHFQNQGSHVANEGSEAGGAATIAGGQFATGTFFAIPNLVLHPEQVLEGLVTLPSRLSETGAKCDVFNPDPIACSRFAGVAGETILVAAGAGEGLESWRAGASEGFINVDVWGGNPSRWPHRKWWLRHWRNRRSRPRAQQLLHQRRVGTTQGA